LFVKHRMSPDTLSREDGWRGFYVEGSLDFSLVGILSRITGTLAEQKIPVFAISTFDTDYILVKEALLDPALSAMQNAGFKIL